MAEYCQHSRCSSPRVLVSVISITLKAHAWLLQVQLHDEMGRLEPLFGSLKGWDMSIEVDVDSAARHIGSSANAYIR